MKTVKSLLLGAAAGFVALTGAQAADLPGKAAPAEYVRICDTYGAGFFFIPGTDTCLRIGGFIRADYYYAERVSAATAEGTFRSRFLLNADARSNTEYGLLRAYGEFFVQRGSGTNYSMVANQAGPAVGTTAQASFAVLSRAFIQFAGMTAGHSASFFNFYQGDLQFVTGLGASADPSRASTNLLAYTASFGSGFSATVSLEDPQYRRQGSLATLSTTLVPGATVIANATQANGVIYNGQSLPNIVANLRVDQGWGSVQVMGALQEVRTSNAGFNFSKMGYAFGAGIRLNLDMLARGDVLWLQAVYADGAIAYAQHSDNSDGLVQSRQTITAGLLTATYADGILTAAGNIQTSKAWGIHGGFRHFWTPALRSAIWGKYVEVDAPGAVGVAGNNLTDFKLWAVGVNTIWSPVRNLDLGLEVVYTDLRTRASGAGFNGTQLLGNDGAWSAALRVQRNF